MNPFSSLLEQAAALAAGNVSSVELTQSYLQRINTLEPALNAFISVNGEAALAAAALADAQRAAGEAGLLTGLPIAHKDLFCTQGVRTSCGSKMLDNFIAPYNATVVARLADAGCITLGKTNMDEFAMGSSNENSYYGPASNPWDIERVPGGSSGGSAVAVSAGLCSAATGTDTGGSIRQPAAFCGITGLKPTYGRVSRWGMVAFASSLDQGGVMARSAADIASVLGAMSGFDPLDSTSGEHNNDWLQRCAEMPMDTPTDLSGLRVGLPREYYAELVNGAAALAEARRLLEAQGATVTEVSLPHTQAAIPAYYVIAGAEASTNLSRYDGVRFGHRCENPQSIDDLYERSRSEGFGSEVKRRILTGTYALSVGYYDAYYLKAQKVRRLIQQDFFNAFEQVDLLLAPTTPDVAFKQGELADPVSMYQQDLYTIPASLAGMPAMSVPCGQDTATGLPLGMQLIGNHWQEQRLLEAAALWQRETDWHKRHPEVAA